MALPLFMFICPSWIAIPFKSLSFNCSDSEAHVWSLSSQLRTLILIQIELIFKVNVAIKSVSFCLSSFNFPIHLLSPSIYIPNPEIRVTQILLALQQIIMPTLPLNSSSSQSPSSILITSDVAQVSISHLSSSSTTDVLNIFHPFNLSLSYPTEDSFSQL